MINHGATECDIFCKEGFPDNGHTWGKATHLLREADGGEWYCFGVGFLFLLHSPEASRSQEVGDEPKANR